MVQCTQHCVKEGTERYHLGRRSSSCILFILQHKVYLIAIHSSFWDQQSASSVGDSPFHRTKRRNERRNHRHYMHHQTPVKRGFVSGFTERKRETGSYQWRKKWYPYNNTDSLGSKSPSSLVPVPEWHRLTKPQTHRNETNHPQRFWGRTQLCIPPFGGATSYLSLLV